ncbi:MAG: D-glycero-beta-D-manno-heptose 1-phosphate adenylyltransferase [Chitinophagaceae bacterium]|jgi:D-beta-D-heptose 7-phosphate kinase/D-beta-D-heptose 1-phosphate adenosyltransferase
MREIASMSKKIVTVEQAKNIIYGWKLLGKTCAFTNGCFDILHQGHIFSLGEAAKEADYLIVGLNSDASVQRLKGPSRPINNTENRAIVLSNLAIVDLLVVFEEDTPLELIKALMPDILVKGGDYTIDQIVGAKEVIAGGGKVIINPIVEGYSTTGLIEKIKK